MKAKKFRFVGVVTVMVFASLTFLDVLLSTMSVVQAASCSDNVLRVKKGASGAADGCSWEDAFPDLQLALAAAQSGDQIWVASGVYTPGLTVSDTFEIPSAVKVYGGFMGVEDDFEQRNWQANPTVLSGDIGGDDVADVNGVVLTTTNIIGDNSYHVVIFDGTTIPITEITQFDGFTITAGDYHGYENGGGGILCNGNGVGSDCSPTLLNINFFGNKSSRDGGAIFIDGGDGGKSNLSLTNIVFSQNRALVWGGGVYNWGYLGMSNPKLMTVTFRANEAGSDTTAGVGGGMDNQDGNPVLINVLFENNVAQYGGGMGSNGSPILTDVIFISNTATIDGGGMINDAYSNPKIFNVKFIKNVARNHGGGMFNYFFADPIMEQVVFLENVATDGLGGGLSNYTGSDPIITDVVFIGNIAVWGGGLYSYDNHLQLENATFLGNTAVFYGGAIGNYDNEITMTNVILSGNYAEKYGGGAYNRNSVVKMNNVTLSGNAADWSGGGMFSYYESDVSVNNSIFWNNQDSSGTGTITATSAISENSVVTLTNSLVQGSGGSDAWLAAPHVDGGGNIDSDPLFIESIDLTTVPTTTGNLRLLSGSPAIDAGDNDLVPVGITEDLDGKPRIIDGVVDMGAYEALWLENYLPLIVR